MTDSKKHENNGYIPRLKKKYKTEIIPSIMKEKAFKNPMAVPRLLKVVINSGVGKAASMSDAKLLEQAEADLAIITGQKPIVTKAKKSIASFKLREGMSIGCKVTLRGGRMYEFLDRYLNIALPRVRDFRGLSMKSFDGKGNYTVGVSEQLIFPEIDYDKVERVIGMNITFVTSTDDDDLARSLLKNFGFPFKEN